MTDGPGDPGAVLADSHQLARAGRLAEARVALEAAMDGFDEDASLDLAITAAALALDAGDLEAAERHAGRAGALADMVGAVAIGGLAGAIAGKARVLAGDTDAGFARLLNGLAMARAGGEPVWEASALLLWGEASLQVGRLADVASAVAAAQSLAAVDPAAAAGDRTARLTAALAVCEGRPEAEALTAALVAAARNGGHALALAHALRWRAAWLRRSHAADAPDVWQQAVVEAARIGLSPLLQALAAPVPERAATPAWQGDTDLAAYAAEAADTFRGLLAAERADLLLFEGFRLTLRTGDDPGPTAMALAYQALSSGASSQAEDLLAVPLGTPPAVLLARRPAAAPERAQAFAARLAPRLAALQRLQVAEQERQAARDLRWLAMEVARAHGVDELMARLTPTLVERLGADRIALVPPAAIGRNLVYGADGRPQRQPRPVSRGVVAWVRTHGRALLLVDVQADEVFGQRASLRALESRMVAAAPLVADGRLQGILYADSRKPRPELAAVGALLHDVGELLGAFLARQAPGSAAPSQTFWNAGSVSQS